MGQMDIAIITEGMRMGTSRNTGSDKQTYYKLSLGGEVQDSVRQMAATLFEGGCVDGDIALAEAAIPFVPSSIWSSLGFRSRSMKAANTSAIKRITIPSTAGRRPGRTRPNT